MAAADAGVFASGSTMQDAGVALTAGADAGEAVMSAPIGARPMVVAERGPSDSAKFVVDTIARLGQVYACSCACGDCGSECSRFTKFRPSR